MMFLLIQVAYFAAAQSVRDSLIFYRNATYDFYEKVNVKQAYYLSMEFLQSENNDGSTHTDFIPQSEPAMSPAIERAVSGMSSPRYNSEFYKNAKVQDMSRSFGWAPFLALQS
ncbi:uncharacterized protein LOC141672758 [Apium graveolens]|uniref:uncharacterized protein LOC141672758 n=1 Tax=Apium graveolens TaxID=4045 RepID=UPI003D7A3D8B